jgi:catechol 2,3-dioxygenase-like lactoylglutathione lyase family enzyme
VAPELDELVVADPPEAWEAAGFAVDADGTCRVGSVRVRLAGPEAGKRIVGWSLRGLPDDTTDIEGLSTAPSDRPAPAPAEHPNGATSLDHVVVLTPDTERTVRTLGSLGVELRRTREVPAEQYGFEASQSFFRLGEPILELLGPLTPTGDGPAGFFGLAWTVADIDALAEQLGPALGRVKDAVQPGRRIATLRHKDVGMSVATAFMTP